MASALVEKLKSLTNVVNDICHVSGTAGVSVGVLSRGEVVFKQGYGFRDIENGLAPDEDTIYYLASMSKAFTAAEIALFVERKKMGWNTPISQMLPRFHHFDETIEDESNIVDWMSHRTGLAPKNLMWSQEHGQSSLRRRDALPMVSYLEKIYDFRTTWVYNNWGYAIADEVTTTLGNRSWGEALKEDIFDPLGMKRSITTHDTKLENVAKGYMAHSDGSLREQPRPFPEDGKVMEGAVAVQSCVRDLLVFYKEIMRAAEDQEKSGKTTTEGSPLVHVPMMMKGHVPLEQGGSMGRSYGLGWIITELPDSLGVIGLNERYLKDMPIAGKGIKEKQTCVYHQGSTNTFLCSVHLLPKSHSGVVVLTNSMANNDAADWIGELFLETILDNPDKNDYVTIAKKSAEISKGLWPKMQRELEAKRIKGTSPKPFDTYVGKYYNKVGTYCIQIAAKGDSSLLMCFQSDFTEFYELDHYHYDVFSWLLTRDQDVRRGRFPDTRANFYLLSFGSDDDSSDIDYLVWVNDSTIPEGETFRRKWPQANGLQRAEGPG